MARALSTEVGGRILASARQVLLDDGVDAFTVEAVCHRSGVAKTTVYRHFANSHELLVAALASFVETVATPNTGSLRNDLIELFSSQLPLVASGTLRPVVLGALAAGARDPELQQVSDAMKRQRREPVRTVVELAVGRGEVRSDIDLDDAVDLIEGPLFLRALVHDLPFTRADLEALIDLAVAGLTARPPAGGGPIVSPN